MPIKAKRVSKKREVAMGHARAILAALDHESDNYRDIILRGSNPFEYGMRDRVQVIADTLIKRKLIVL